MRCPERRNGTPCSYSIISVHLEPPSWRKRPKRKFGVLGGGILLRSAFAFATLGCSHNSCAGELPRSASSHFISLLQRREASRFLADHGKHYGVGFTTKLQPLIFFWDDFFWKSVARGDVKVLLRVRMFTLQMRAKTRIEIASQEWYQEHNIQDITTRWLIWKWKTQSSFWIKIIAS